MLSLDHPAPVTPPAYWLSRCDAGHSLAVIWNGLETNWARRFCTILHADWEKHGRSVIERVRRDDPSAYLRVMASFVRPASEPEAEDPLADMTFEELKTELLAGFASLFPELRVVAAHGGFTIE